MPLPDANKKSPRVYPLLQNTDLENIAFATLQSTGTPIAIEEMNEDELRRLVLVNLARLSVKGEWSGLLTAASGGDYSPVVTAAGRISATYDIDCVTTLPPWGVGAGTSGIGAGWAKQQPILFPFIAPTSGTVDSMLINVSQAAGDTNTLECGIYSDDDGVPDSLLTKAIFDGETSGEQEQTSLTGEAVLVRGTQYWIGHCETATDGFKCSAIGISTAYSGPQNTMSGGPVCYMLTGSDYSLPSSITASDLAMNTYTETQFYVGLKYT